MSNAKKSFVTAMCLVLCLTTFSAPTAMAADRDVNTEYAEIMPLMEYIYAADQDFVISGGKANMYAVVSGHSNLATKCEVTVELQKKGLLFWNTVKTWTTTESGRRAEVEATYGVTPGETYRIVTTVTVWSGTASETQTMTSGSLKA